MSIPTVGEQRFQAQLLNALDELAGAIRENTGALRELAGKLRDIPGKESRVEEAWKKFYEHLDGAQTPVRRPAPPSPPPGEDRDNQVPPGQHA